MSVTKYILLPLQEHMRFRMNVATAPNVAGKSTRRCKKNIPSIIVTSTCWGSIDFALDSNSFKSLNFGVFCIVPSTRPRDKGTGFKGYLKTSAMSIFFCSDWYRILPSRSLINVAAASLLSALFTLNLFPLFAKVFSR